MARARTADADLPRQLAEDATDVRLFELRAVARHEERRHGWIDLVSLPSIVRQHGTRGPMQRHQPCLIKLRGADRDDSIVEVHVFRLEIDGFADAHPGDG